MNPPKVTGIDKSLWPKQLITPSEFTQVIHKLKSTKIDIVKSPLTSKLVLQFIGGLSYFLAHVMNKSKVVNFEAFKKEIQRREAEAKETGSTPKAPLLTLSNHISCIDDPVLWAVLHPLSYYSTNTDLIRWAPAAVEICFLKPWYSSFFSLGRTFPIIRGGGLDQPAMEFALGLLKTNQWLHFFPEGRVMRDDDHNVISNKDRGYIFRWGISRLVLDFLCTSKSTQDKTIRILPLYHLGLDKILPLGWPYFPRAGHQLTVAIRPKPIEMDSYYLTNILTSTQLPSSSVKSKTDDQIKLIKVTRYLETEIDKLIDVATRHHKEVS